MFDTTKVFDRVQYCKLFRKLIDRNNSCCYPKTFAYYVH